MRPDLFHGLTLDHVKFYVSDAATEAAYLAKSYGFDVRISDSAESGDEARSRALRLADVEIILTEARSDNHPGAAFVQAHGDGVADIALRTSDARSAFDEAVRRGARPITTPAERDSVVTATIAGFGDVVHTFVQRSESGPAACAPTTASPEPSSIDHFAVCLEAGDLDPTVAFYCDVLDFEAIFSEYISVGEQAMHSRVVQSRSRDVTFTLIEPDTTRAPGQIDEFIKNHGGAGVQHIALTTSDIVAAIEGMSSRGVEFLPTPHSYYELLRDRIILEKHSVQELEQFNILVDEDHDGQLYQIFARSTHPRNTFFFEVIERSGATTFGSGNIKALYEAVEMDSTKAAR